MSTSNDSASLRLPFSFKKSASSILPTTQQASHDMVSVLDSIQSLVTTKPAPLPKKIPQQVSSIVSDIESFAKSDNYSKCEAYRREDGSLRIHVSGKVWDHGTIAETMNDPSTEDEIMISATRRYDDAQNPFILIEFKRFREIGNSIYPSDGMDLLTSPAKSRDLVEKHTVSVNTSGKVKTSFPADRKFEVLNGIDALKSAVRRLLELELYKDRGFMEGDTNSKEVLKKLHVHDNFDPGKNLGNFEEKQFRGMERQLGDINRILQMVE